MHQALQQIMDQMLVPFIYIDTGKYLKYYEVSKLSLLTVLMDMREHLIVRIPDFWWMPTYYPHYCMRINSTTITQVLNDALTPQVKHIDVHSNVDASTAIYWKPFHP